MTKSISFLSKLLCAVLVLGDCLLIEAQQFVDPMPSMVIDNGYPLEFHSTTTSDGYILGMHRIPYGIKSPAAPNKPVVLLMHAMSASSYSFVYIGKDHSLGFILADAGYDVWMGNSRGNDYARSNIFVSPESPAFWQFSWHERGALDLPAMIDYVLDETKQEKLSYVSMSRGGTMFFVLMSTMPEYNDRIKVAITMAPGVFFTQAHSALQEVMTQSSRFIEWISIFIWVNEFHMTPALMTVLDVDKCKSENNLGSLCEQMFWLTGGFDSKSINKTKMSDIAKGSVKGTSVKELAHFAQLVTSKKFAMYDYSLIGNVGRYGSLFAPSYDLSKVTAPVVVMSSRDDTAVTTEEINILLNALPNLIQHVLIEEPGFTHFDFTTSDDAKTIVYGKILSHLEMFSDA